MTLRSSAVYFAQSEHRVFQMTGRVGRLQRVEGLGWTFKHTDKKTGDSYTVVLKWSGALDATATRLENLAPVNDVPNVPPTPASSLPRAASLEALRAAFARIDAKRRDREAAEVETLETLEPWEAEAERLDVMAYGRALSGLHLGSR